MSTLTQQAALAVNPGFQARVRAAMITEAAAVLALPADTAHPQQYTLRTGLATAIMGNAAPYLERFAWAAATTPVVAQADMSLYGIASTAIGPPAVITTTAPITNLATGAIVAIASAADPILNGSWPITVTGPSTFTIPVAGSAPGGAGGTVTDQPTDSGISSAVHAVWNDIAGITMATV